MFIFHKPIFSQNGFHFNDNTDKVTIPFKFINNLIFIPIKVNGVELNFLLDTGVEETLLFSLEDKKEVGFYNIEKISFIGLGGADSIEGLKSTNNTLEIKNFISTNHLLYIILDQDFNLSSHIGIPVNGILGYHFFKNYLVEINYDKRRIIVYKDNSKYKNRIEKKYKKIPITIEKSKPYMVGKVVVDVAEIPSKLLIDIGNSDAIWLFQNLSNSIKIPFKNFDDYLGKGFSGDVEGKRARISKISIADFNFYKPIVAFPDSSSIKNVKMVADRVGSIGGEILKRFLVVFDYANKQMYLRKSKNFSLPFGYNKSGLEIQHNGLQWVQETVRLETIPLQEYKFDSQGKRGTEDFKYKFQLKPIYEIANVRKNSPAANCGLQKGDIIISINKIPSHKYSLQKINSILKSEGEKWIYMEVERGSLLLKYSFQLLDVL